jgi:hypothetical protein
MLLEAGWYWVLLIAACFAGLYHWLVCKGAAIVLVCRPVLRVGY